eukprot:gnl/TRDRNA2_/TRDRNA2_130789_c0_seq1.p1 gnl/TRDRNA2_/TRDRNA2_130789_c0~~gnl/TRDRNA2_/TRDRNA2_130789_c0_seq1.p1  ORF type:complete len:486 (+),score=57.47 gnl/TRDRNA2_/TRDRNA2_130789_c0_seq1:64-1521(+)
MCDVAVTDLDKRLPAATATSCPESMIWADLQKPLLDPSLDRTRARIFSDASTWLPSTPDQSPRSPTGSWDSTTSFASGHSSEQQDAIVDNAAPKEGTSNLVTTLVLVKTFLTGTLVLIPAGFRAAGVVAGCIIISSVAAVELYCMCLLVRCRAHLGSGTYGDLANSLGRHGGKIVSWMVITSQYAFVCAEQIYVADNVLMCLRPRWPDLQQWHILLLMQVVLVPMSWLRKLEFYAFTNLVGNGIIVGIVIYLFAFGISRLEQEGMSPEIVEWGPPDRQMMFLGTCVYIYEGINMVLPIYEEHDSKQSFEWILSLVIAALTFVFVAFGILWYSVFGDDVQGIATLNLPTGSVGVLLVPAAYAVACLFTTPVLFFPLAELLEAQVLHSWLLTTPPRTKTWLKNMLWSVMMLISAVIAAVGGKQLHNFLGLIGGLLCGPLAIVLPSMIHLRICKPGPGVALFNKMLIVFGLFITILCTWIAVMGWKST